MPRMTSVPSLARRAALIGAIVITFGYAHSSAQDPRLIIKPDEVKWPPAAAGDRKSVV